MSAAWYDPRIARGMAQQLTRWHQRLKAGEKAIGWKAGFGTADAMERHKLHAAARCPARDISAGISGAHRALTMIEPAGIIPVAARGPLGSSNIECRSPARKNEPPLRPNANVQRSRISATPATISDTGRVEANGSKVRAC